MVTFNFPSGITMLCTLISFRSNEYRCRIRNQLGRQSYITLDVSRCITIRTYIHTYTKFCDFNLEVVGVVANSNGNSAIPRYLYPVYCLKCVLFYTLELTSFWNYFNKLFIIRTSFLKLFRKNFKTLYFYFL